MRIRFDKFDGFSRTYDRARFIALFGSEKCGAIYDEIRYFRGQYHGITCVLFDNYARIKIDSYESFPLDKTLTLHNVIIFIKSVFNKDQIGYRNVTLD